jgi:hypothetical protein
MTAYRFCDLVRNTGRKQHEAVAMMLRLRSAAQANESAGVGPHAPRSGREKKADAT